MDKILNQIFRVSLCLIFLIPFSNTLYSADYCTNLPQLVYQQLTAANCDSLIKANESNPNFVILDVRTPGEYNPQHIEGAINRNYYDADFAAQLAQLDKNKTYLLHCKSGGRSRNVFSAMQNSGFREVYELQNGINAWVSGGFPTSSDFAAKLGIYECSYISNDTININKTDTINFTISNQANSILTIQSIQIKGGINFSADFEQHISLLGSENHTFQILYASATPSLDSIQISIESNGGNKNLKMVRLAQTATGIKEELKNSISFYPNPAKHLIHLEHNFVQPIESCQIYSMTGQLVFSQQNINQTSLNISELKNGSYILQISTKNKIFSDRLIISK